ncbi:MAG: hypothetical protein AAFX94_06000 [Myxococcota bacterium]
MDVKLRVLVSLERVDGEARWVCECVEYDIASEGRSLSEAKREFEETLYALHEYWQLHGLAPFSTVPPGPAEREHRWLDGADFGDDVQPSATIPPWMAEALSAQSFRFAT